MDLREEEWGGMDWIHTVQDKGSEMGSCKYDNEVAGSIKCCKIS
jgi:hypothetical protein